MQTNWLSAFLLGAVLAPFSPAQDSLETAFADWRSRQDQNWQLVPAEGTGYAQMIHGGSLRSTYRPARDEDFLPLAITRLAETRSLHGIEQETLSFARTQFLPLAQIGSSDKLVVKFQQIVRGVRVVDGWVNVLFDMQGTLLAIQSTSLPSVAQFNTAPRLDADTALARAQALFLEHTGFAANELPAAPELVILRYDADSGREARLCWQIDLQWHEENTDPLGNVHWIDANTGELLKRESSIHHFDVGGTVYTKASPGTLPDTTANPETQQVMKYAAVTSSAGTVYTDANGNFNFPGITGPLDVTVQYSGSFNYVTNNGGAPTGLTSTISGTGNTIVLNTANAATVTSQANAFIGVNKLRDWVRAVNPTDPFADFVAFADVNQASTCNAFYNGFSINFFAAGGSCVNTSYSTVVSHEHGHWMNVRYGTGNGSDGMGEGNADCWAMYVWDTPIVGEGFSGTGTNIRTGTNTSAFCGDGNPACYGQVHSDGRPWMGAAWKIRNRLNVALGNAQGDLVANTLFLTWMETFNQTQIKSVIETQWLTLDDNDGNIGNGTPHYTHVDGGFRDQGFPGYTIPSLAIVNVTDLADTPFEAGPYVVNATITANTNPPVQTATLRYRVNGGALQSIPMTSLGSNNYTAAIPGQTGPAYVQYYIQATDNASLTSYWPPSAGADYLDFDVGNVSTLLFHTFDLNNDQGWTHGLTTGTDDWARGPGNAKSGSSGGVAWVDPRDGYFSGRCWGTDLGTGTANGAYPSNSNYWLRSPTINCSGAVGTKLRFKRWLSVQGSANDQARIRVNGTQVWINPTTNLTETAWSAQEIDISALADGNASVQIEFSLQTNGSTAFGGWNIDDVKVLWVSQATQPCAPPTSYCISAPNSYDPNGVVMGYAGSTYISNNDFVLQAFGVPPLKAGLFFYGANQAQVTFGNGYRCVGSPFTRLPLINANDLGDMYYPVDFNTLPASGPILPGSVLNFTLWYRDPDAGGANFNAANGLQVTFCQ
jgi:hypothetical protein